MTTPLARLTTERGLSGRTLAQTAGVNANSVCRFINGTAAPHPRSAHRIAAVLNVPVTDLWPHLPDTPLARILAERNQSGRQLATATGMQYASLCHVIAGRTVPLRTTAYKIAATLDVPLADLWPQLAPTSIAELLANHRLTAEQLANAIGVSKSTVTDWQAGRCHPNSQSAAKLAAFVLGVPYEPPPTRPKQRPKPTDTDNTPLLPPKADVSWMSHAACATGEHDPDLWWPEPGDLGLQARQICAACPVITACRDAFLAAPLPDDSCIIAGVTGSELLARTRPQAA